MSTSRLSWNIEPQRPVYPPPKITITPTREQAVILRNAMHAYLREQEGLNPASEWKQTIQSMTKELDDLVRSA